MTRTSALPAQVATDALSRRVAENLGDGADADQSSKFPELLGRLTAHQTSDQHANVQASVSGDIGTRDPSQPPVPWKFRIADALVLTGGADVPSAGAASSDRLVAVTTVEMVANTGEVPDSILSLASDLLAGEQGGKAGEPEGTEDTQAAAAQSDPQMLEPVRHLPVDANALLDAGIAVVAENSRRTTAAPSDAQVLVGTRERRAGLSADLTISLGSKAGGADPMRTASVGDGSEPTAPHMPSMEVSDATGSHRQARDQETPPIAAGEAKVTVLRTETHLPPMGHTLPMQQIAERLEAELGSVEAGAFKADNTSFSSVSARPYSAVKVLHIQLQPAELGTVTVRMSLKRDALEVQLDVSRQDAAHALRQDRETLSKVLQSAGYVLDAVVVHIVEPDRTASPTQLNIQGNHATAQSSLQSQSGWSQPDGQPSDMQRQAEHAARRSSAPSDTSVNDATGARAANDGVYL